MTNCVQIADHNDQALESLPSDLHTKNLRDTLNEYNLKKDYSDPIEFKDKTKAEIIEIGIQKKVDQQNSSNIQFFSSNLIDEQDVTVLDLHGYDESTEHEDGEIEQEENFLDGPDKSYGFNG